MRTISPSGVVSVAAIVSFTMTSRTGKPQEVGRGHSAPTFLRSVYVACAAFAMTLALPHFAAALECGDVDGSGTVTATDSLLVLNKAVGIDVPVQCPCGGLIATGQKQSYGPGTDGDIENGVPASYSGNGDGTITDNNTGLMWEKKDSTMGIHGVDRVWSWSSGDPWSLDGSVRFFLDTLNTQEFAGYDDWRLPNVKELQTLVDHEESTLWGSTHREFHGFCDDGCTNLSSPFCGCTAFDSVGYWSSTTWLVGSAISVGFDNGGFMGRTHKKELVHARAVRGGL